MNNYRQQSKAIIATSMASVALGILCLNTEAAKAAKISSSEQIKVIKKVKSKPKIYQLLQQAKNQSKTKRTKST